MPSTFEPDTGTADAAPSPSPLVGEGAQRADEGSPQVPPRRADRFEVKPRQRAFARSLRRRATPEEDTLWYELRARRFSDYKFRRQVPIGPYIADFACHSARLVVELDGSQHAESARDVVRDKVIAGHGFRILRIWNNELTHARDSVLDAIWHALNTEGEPS